MSGMVEVLWGLKVPFGGRKDGFIHIDANAAHAIATELTAAGFGPVKEAQREAWAEGHESGFWNGRESAGHDEMRHVGLEHAQINNPYGAAASALGISLNDLADEAQMSALEVKVGLDLAIDILTKERQRIEA